MKLSDESVISEPQHVLVFGDPGSGKSTLVSQLAEAGWNLIWISCDNGHRVLRKLSPAAQARIELVRVPDTRDYPAAVDAFRELFKYKLCSLCDTHGKHNCSVCKSANSSFTEVNLGRVLADTIVVWDNLSQLSDSYLSLICKGQPVDYKPKLDDWGSLRYHLLKALGDIQVAPFHFIGIAHAVEEEMTDKSKKIMPAIGSSTFAPKAAGFFDHAIYCHPMNNKHRFGSSTTYMNNVVTKSREDIQIEKMTVAELTPFFRGAPPKVDRTAKMLEESRVVATQEKQEQKPVVAEFTLNVPVVEEQKLSSTSEASEAADRARQALLKLRGKK